MKKLYILLFLAFLVAPELTQAQEEYDRNIHTCGTPPVHTEWFNEYARNRTAYRTGADTVLYVPVTIQVLGTDNGSGYLSMAKILEGFCKLNNDFANNNSNIQFYIEDTIIYINNSFWYNHDSTSHGYQMMMQNNVPNTINCYIVGRAAGNGGYNLPSAQAIALLKSAVNGNNDTWSHEIGHNLTVQHPFLGWEGNSYSYGTPTPTHVTYNYTPFKPTFYNPNDTTIIDTALVELVNGSNCAIAADKICDTPPDYLAAGNWTCNAQGLSNILQKDPNNDDFRSVGSNIMNYSACSGSVFTPGQIAAMRANLLTEKASYLYNQNLQVDTIQASHVNLLHPTQGETVNFSAVDFIWNKVPGATHYIFQIGLTSTFGVVLEEVITTDTIVTSVNLLNNRTLYWRMQPFNHEYTCTSNSQVWSFVTADLTNVENVTGVENYSLNPNLIYGNQMMNFDIKTSQTLDASIYIVSANGQIVNNETTTFQAGQNNYPVRTNGLAAGMYVFVVKTENGIIRDKFVVLE